jgi:hypothetical protein
MVVAAHAAKRETEEQVLAPLERLRSQSMGVERVAADLVDETKKLKAEKLSGKGTISGLFTSKAKAEQQAQHEYNERSKPLRRKLKELVALDKDASKTEACATA